MFGAYHLMFISVNNLSDARYAAALGADYLSFNFDPKHPMSVSAASAKAMAQWVSGPLVGAELTQEHKAKNASDYIDVIGLDLVVVSIEQADEMQTEGVDFMLRSPDINPELLSFLRAMSHFKGFLLEPASLDLPVSLLRSENVYTVLPALGRETVEWISRNKPFGIALRGEMEDTPGYRDFEEVNAFFDQLEEASSAA